MKTNNNPDFLGPFILIMMKSSLRPISCFVGQLFQCYVGPGPTTPLARFFAGHSKWHNIRHRKGAADAKRAQTLVKIGAELTAASRLCRGDLNNGRLAAAISKAKDSNMPKVNVDAAIERGATGKGPAGESVKYEGIGPGNVSIIVEALTDNRHRTGPAVRHLFVKHGGALQTEGSCMWIYKRLGSCEVPVGDSSSEQDALFTTALEGGAVDVEFFNLDPKEDGGKIMLRARILCEVGDLGKLRTALIASGHLPSIIEIIWLPKSDSDYIELSADSIHAENFMNLLSGLEDNDDVQSVFHNAK